MRYGMVLFSLAISFFINFFIGQTALASGLELTPADNLYRPRGLGASFVPGAPQTGVNPRPPVNYVTCPPVVTRSRIATTPQPVRSTRVASTPARMTVPRRNAVAHFQPKNTVSRTYAARKPAAARRPATRKVASIPKPF